MKNITLFSLLLISLFLTGFNNSTNLNTKIQDGQGRILGQNVIIRSSHSTESSKKGVLSLNQIVSVLDVLWEIHGQMGAVLWAGFNYKQLHRVV